MDVKLNRLILFILTISVSAHAQDYVPGELIVKYKGKKFSASAQSASQKIMNEKGMSLKSSWHGLNMDHFALKPGDDVEAAAQDLMQDPNVEYAEPNYYLKKATENLPDEVMTKEQFEVLFNEYSNSDAEVGAQNISYSQTGAPVEIPEAWAQMSSTSYKPTIAVIDTGIDLQHVDLSSALWANTGEIPSNGIDDDGNGFVDDINGWNFVNNNNNPDDCDGHGTHVAGIIRGTSQDILANPLPAAKIKLMAVKFLDCNGNGTTSAAVQSIYYAVNNGARVLNNSWGGGSYSYSLHEAIAYSYSHQASFVAAAGNSGLNNDVSPMYPASYNVPNIISVSATTDADNLASFSNYGVSKVHLASPGVGIYSTYLNNMYASLSGTSMAAPFVSGVVAIMAREKQTMNGYQLKQLILNNVDTKSNLNGVVQTGGRVNALYSLNAAQSAAVDAYQPSYDVSANGNRGPASDMQSGGGCGLVSKLYKDYNDNQTKFQGPHNMTLNIVLVGLLIALPFALAMALKTQGQTRRRWDRFKLGSKIYVETIRGEFLGSVGTISIGGLELKTDQHLAMSDKVRMVIESPDGKEFVEVHGKIVWCNENGGSFGVSFVEVQEKSLLTIHTWTKQLVKAN